MATIINARGCLAGLHPASPPARADRHRVKFGFSSRGKREREERNPKRLVITIYENKNDNPRTPPQK